MSWSIRRKSTMQFGWNKSSRNFDKAKLFLKVFLFLSAVGLQIANVHSCHRASNACWGVLIGRASRIYMHIHACMSAYERDPTRINYVWNNTYNQYVWPTFYVQAGYRFKIYRLISLFQQLFSYHLCLVFIFVATLSSLGSFVTMASPFVDGLCWRLRKLGAPKASWHKKKQCAKPYHVKHWDWLDTTYTQDVWSHMNETIVFPHVAFIAWGFHLRCALDVMDKHQLRRLDPGQVSQLVG